MSKNLVFTLPERQKIEDLLKKYPNISISKISYELGRSRTGTGLEIRRNGGREKYKAEEAHAQFLERREKHAESKRESIKKEDHPISRMKARIDNLEFQLEIVIEELKKLTTKR